MDLILLTSSVLVLIAAAVILYVLKRKQYVPILYIASFALLGLVGVTIGHKVLYGIGMFAFAAIVAVRLAVDRAKKR